jgi:hypothetical protein
MVCAAEALYAGTNLVTSVMAVEGLDAFHWALLRIVAAPSDPEARSVLCGAWLCGTVLGVAMALHHKLCHAWRQPDRRTRKRTRAPAAYDRLQRAGARPARPVAPSSAGRCLLHDLLLRSARRPRPRPWHGGGRHRAPQTAVAKPRPNPRPSIALTWRLLRRPGGTTSRLTARPSDLWGFGV